jgi:hypothetical protein
VTTANTIYPTIYHTTCLKQINHVLLDDLKLPVIGEGTYFKYTGKYGHIKIRISSCEVGNYYSTCNWNVTDDIIPFIYKKNVEKVISFFITYLAGLTGEDKHFIFEVIGGSHHPVDGRPTDYEIATLHSIVNAFDNNICKPSIDRIYAD